MNFVTQKNMFSIKYIQFPKKNIITSYDVAHDNFSQNAKLKDIPGNTAFHN